VGGPCLHRLCDDLADSQRTAGPAAPSPPYGCLS
jgi:hypothetical protein